ncbi:hypothetical protein EYF80_015524 [Liparis tanakae]|uniref:Uncharacterized protein n=1 Tax=Liparis tanakae TaxID=230148 RepID=A0A4Z2I958_9TELE|nr:hypothetical protein EYF80_015524 [Liparis tanakae]
MKVILKLQKASEIKPQSALGEDVDVADKALAAELNTANDSQPAVPTCYNPTIRPFQHPKQSSTLLQSRRLAGPSMARALPRHSHSDNSEALNPVFRFPRTHLAEAQKGERRRGG